MGVINAISPSPAKLVVCLVFAVFSLFTSGFSWNKKEKEHLITLIVCVFIAWFFNVISVIAQSGENPLRLATLLYMLYAIIVTVVLTHNKVSLIPLKVTFYLIAFYFYYQCVVLEVLADELFMFSAGGMMSSILFSIAIPIQLFDYRWNRRVTIIPPIVILLVSVYSISRTALICAVIYFALNLLVISFGNKRRIFWGILFIAIVIVLGYRWVFQSLDELSALDIYNKFEYMGMDTSGRDKIWGAYLKELDIATFILGRNVDKTHMIIGFANTHNSFIQMHSQIGILSFAFLFYFLKTCVYYIKNDVYLFGLLMILVLRCSFDSLFFFNIYDFAILVFMLDYKGLDGSKDNSIKISII